MGDKRGADLTVVVATYERPQWLEESLRSIQRAADLAAMEGIRSRILVVDDASPSALTRDVADRLSVDYVRTAANDGRRTPAAARAFGLVCVDSPFFCFFDDDDLMLPEFVRRCMRELRHGADVVQQAYVLADGDLRPRRINIPYPAHLGDMLADHNAVNDFAMIRRDVATDVWNPSLGKLMMFGAWLELAFRGAHFVVVRDPMFLYRQHGENMSAALDAAYWRTRAELVQRYREKVRARDGTVPPPTIRLRIRRVLSPIGRRLFRP